MLFPCALWPPGDAFFWRRGCGRLGQPKELPTGQKMIGFRQCRRSESKGNFVGFLRK